MGILKVGVGAAQGVLADSWREYFYCDAMDVDVLAKKGEQRQSKRGFNTKKSENIISNGSIIVVNEGQCMMIVEQGKVVEVCAEAGEFLYDSATEPSLFYGDLKESIKESFRQFGKRVGFGGDPAGDQRIYYFNTKEILGNKYGTSNPVPFRVVDTNIGLDIDIAIRCHGEYAYHLRQYYGYIYQRQHGISAEKRNADRPAACLRQAFRYGYPLQCPACTYHGAFAGAE